MPVARAVFDRLLIALASLLGVYLPDGVGTLGAAVLVAAALYDGWHRRRERDAVLALVERLGLEEPPDGLERLVRRAGGARRTPGAGR